ARFVRHRIRLDVDGTSSEIDTLHSTSWKEVLDQRELIRGMSDDATDALNKLTTRTTIEIGAPDGDYFGVYSTVVPREPARACQGGFNEWTLDGTTITLGDYIVGTEQSIFVKGIQVGSVGTKTSTHSR